MVGVAGGNVAWTYEDAASDTTSDPAYVTTVLSSTDGSVVWSHDGAVGDAVIAAAAADGDRLVGDLGAAAQPTDSGGVLDASAGTVVWQGAPSLTPPLVVTATTAIWPVVDADGIASSPAGLRLGRRLRGLDHRSPGRQPGGHRVGGRVVLYVVVDAETGRTLQTYDVGSGQSLSTVTLAEGDQCRGARGQPDRGQRPRVGRRRGSAGEPRALTLPLARERVGGAATIGSRAAALVRFAERASCRG